MELDRTLMTQVIERELFGHPTLRGNWSALEREAGLSHSTISRLKRADERITASTFRKIEASLGLPFDTLATIGVHDVDGAADLGVDDALVRWLKRQVKAS